MELEQIQRNIYEIRSQRVMLDFDLAALYQVETRVLNQAVKRNLKRFPEDFVFQLTKSEWENMSSQFVMTLRSKRPKTAIPLAFTEHGVVMLSSILRSDIAIQASIFVVRAFVAIRQLILNPPVGQMAELERQVRELREYIEDVFTDYNDINEDTRMQLELINQSLAELQAKKRIEDRPRRRIGYIIEDKENG
ncbi:MAG: ORF6N domain-containing protein [Prevotellaceae bacterium]|nr:ORF6N domain-containing protein [Prevotellaceae bacterium]